MTISAKRQARAEKLAQNLHGEGLFVYENKSGGDLILPKATASGVKHVPHEGQFQGDSYFMQFVPRDLKVIRVIQSPEEQKQMNEASQHEEKLILDQPDVVTNEGTVEQVKEDTPLNEESPQPQPPKEVLLVEEPLDGVDILVD